MSTHTRSIPLDETTLNIEPDRMDFDCTEVFEDLGDTMSATPEGAARMAHLCGVEFEQDWQDLDDAA
jgi:hypothetical protein